MNTLVVVETFVAFIIAVTLHELAHAGMATVLGDGSSLVAGRLSFNPRRQMASVGTIVALTLSFGIPLGGIPVGLGWGKPIGVDTRRMRVGPDAGIFLVALAGPAASLLIGMLLALGLHFVPNYESLAFFANRCAIETGSNLQVCLAHAEPWWELRIFQFVYVLAVTNVLLALVNLIPLHPLDGYGMLFALLPNGPAVRYRDFQPYMELILLVLFFLVPYLFEMLRLGGLNPGFWLGQWANGLAAGVAGSAYPAFAYTL